MNFVCTLCKSFLLFVCFFLFSRIWSPFSLWVVPLCLFRGQLLHFCQMILSGEVQKVSISEKPQIISSYDLAKCWIETYNFTKMDILVITLQELFSKFSKWLYCGHRSSICNTIWQYPFLTIIIATITKLSEPRNSLLSISVHLVWVD